MRWGVRDEATDDHMTTELCMKEIENCQRLSMGPNFVECETSWEVGDFADRLLVCRYSWGRNTVTVPSPHTF